MIQGRLSLCMTCGHDDFLHPHIHKPDNQAVTLYQCPVCRKYTLESEDPNDSVWVALGEAVCSRQCHEKAYDLMRETQHTLPFHPPP